jgi:hypothetical protein
MERVSSKRELTLLKVYNPLSPNQESVYIYQGFEYLRPLLELDVPIKEIRSIRLPTSNSEDLKFCSIAYLPGEGI